MHTPQTDSTASSTALDEMLDDIVLETIDDVENKARLEALSLTRGREILINGFIWAVVKSTLIPRRITLKPVRPATGGKR